MQLPLKNFQLAVVEKSIRDIEKPGKKVCRLAKGGFQNLWVSLDT